MISCRPLSGIWAVPVTHFGPQKAVTVILCDSWGEGPGSLSASTWVCYNTCSGTRQPSCKKLDSSETEMLWRGQASHGENSQEKARQSARLGLFLPSQLIPAMRVKMLPSCLYKWTCIWLLPFPPFDGSHVRPLPPATKWPLSQSIHRTVINKKWFLFDNWNLGFVIQQQITEM